MDYLDEAKKFIQRARDAHNSEVKDQDLAMADWCVSQAIKEREEGDEPAPAKARVKKAS
jgi:hypothetical protein